MTVDTLEDLRPQFKERMATEKRLLHVCILIAHARMFYEWKK